MQLNALAMATSALLAFGSAPLHAQTWQMPPDNQRCPSKWGAADQRGSANMMKPESILRAAKLIKTGELFELAAVLSPDPKEAFLNANRVFNIYTKPALPVPNARVANEELIVSELGQIGTQFDAFALKCGAIVSTIVSSSATSARAVGSRSSASRMSVA